MSKQRRGTGHVVAVVVALGSGALSGVLVASVAAVAPSSAATPPQITFTPPTNYAVGFRPNDVAAGDFNRDGLPDLAVVNRGCPTTSAPFYCSTVQPGGVSILLGTGDGNFAPPTLLSTGGFRPYALTIGDFNGDHAADLAVTNNSTDNLAVLLGTGEGSFGPPTTFSTGASSFPADVTTADFNGDGHLDLAAVTDGVAVLLGDGTGSFGPPTTYPAGTFSLALAVGDFNRDGIPDLAVANLIGSASVSVLLGKGDGTFQPAMSVPDGGSNPIAVVAGDFNRDGVDDLAVANQGSASVSVLLSNGDGTFGPPTLYPAGPSPQGLAIGDFNIDGIPDLAVTNASSSSVSVLVGTGTGSFSAPISFPTGVGPVAVAVGDFNRDGQPDLATANDFSGNVSVLLNSTYPSPTLTCSRVTPTTGASYLKCRATATLGIKRFRVVDLRTRLTEQSTAFSCAPARKMTTTSFRIPDDGNAHRVVVTDCTTGVNHSFVVAPDGRVATT